MPRFAANLTMLFAELPYADRFRAAAESGFHAVEILDPYGFAAEDTRRALSEAALELVLINAPPPDRAGGVPGYAAVPGGEGRFAEDLERVLRHAAALAPGRIHLMAGDAAGATTRDTFVANLRHAADLAPRQGFTIEPLNPVARPGYFLNDYSQAAEVLAAVDRPNLGPQFDSYHAQMIHGDALAVWREYRPLIVHAQVGSAPDRQEPGPGPIDFAALFAAMDESGYDGWVSAEYTPSTARTEDSLGWMSV
ncbi:hydroxypyruvate isomerase [Cribrihabitans marinus]|uniref:Hydroxypyruvate isomerase n=1 Tax=Cribrihabitans marinus TaxID=1227549 RepID=A0A1H6Y0D7_9RHOB|nr:TIM barrel protein [Cribrihabitans marinus]GGH28217.1 hydroxypyruvate isomerase [Cribrihabitans marinus]SEJ33906.1 hydroxypyruvate isomerase [Cribrihabitans marinus]